MEEEERGGRGPKAMSGQTTKMKFPPLLHRVSLNSHTHKKLEQNNVALLKLSYKKG